ncbi:MAG: stage II sporulation protein P [Clostridia bacterium]|nr:stage II sporulation protein P [Clostridia bacterium]
MQKRWAIIRILTCYLLCFFLILGAFYNIISQKIEVKNDNFLLGFSDNLTVFEATKTEEKPQNETTETKENSQNITLNSSQNSSVNSVQTSTSSVKGNVIEKYISPYTAPLSYSGVYMKNSSGLSINIKNLLSSKLKFKIEKNSQPQVLIMHTHTTETFLNEDKKTYTENDKARTTDNNKNMVMVGEIIAKKLNEAGIKTLHDKTQHDYPQYTGSYSRSAKTVNSYLSKYKSIKIVLDLHRDSVTVSGNDKAKLVTKINGKKAAQVMLVMGSQSGSIKNHPNWQENLKLALKFQQTMEAKYPTLARPLVLASKNYNQSLCSGSMLIEFGTEMNSLDEAKYSAELVGNSLVSLLNTIK